MRGNTIRINLEKKTLNQAEESLYQGDYGQRLIIEGLDLPSIYTVHFGNSATGENKAMVGDETGVNIPDEYLATGEPVHVWVFLHVGEDDGETERHGIIKVIAKGETVNEPPTPAQQSALDTAITALESGVAAAQEAQAAAEAAKTAAEGAAAHYPYVDSTTGNWMVWDGNTGAFIDTGYKAVGTDGQPGVGITKIEKTSTSGLVDTYTITFSNGNDTTFTVTNGSNGLDGQDATPALITVNYSDLTFPVAKDTQCYHDGLLYYAKQNIQTSEVWTAAHWQQTTVEEQQRLLLNAIDGVEDDLADPVGFLEANDFDAESGGKVNVLAVPYAIADILTGKIIYSNGSINDSANNDVSPLIPVSAGTYGLKTAHNQYVGILVDGNNYKNGYGFFATDGQTVVSRPTNLLHQISTDIYVFDVPEGAKYVRFCYKSGANYRETALGFFNQWILLPNANDNIDDSFFTLSPKKQNGEINKVMRRDGSHLEIVDTEAREKADEALARPITFGRRTFAIFEKVACIGDSYTSGYIMDTQDVSHTNGKYSWVEHLKNMTGREYVNLGIGGATTASWLTDQNGLAKAQIPANKAQAYIIGLQINDASFQLPVGTVSDIGTENQTYYGCTSKIIDEMFTINNDAHIFLLTQPKNYTGEHTPYREAILAIAEWYQTNGTHQEQVHLIDLLDYWKLFENAGCNDAKYGGHFTPVGYEYVAEIMLFALSNYLNANPLTFQDVNLIPFGTE